MLKVSLGLCAVTCALLAVSAHGAPEPLPRPVAGTPARFDGTVSVLTYNIRGLPWPVALGRSDALAAITRRLQEMRREGRAPQIVALQEAFTGEAQAIGAAAGYGHVVNGPDAELAGEATVAPADRAFAARVHWWKGETEGKMVGSGLMILSDYPIVASRAMAFPASACAGFDCLANKGALLVSVDIPGVATPLDVLTTHLNSRNAARVSWARSDYAYRQQVAALTSFIRSAHNPHNPLIAAGDFNVGLSQTRRAVLLDDARPSWDDTGDVRDALGEAGHRGAALSADAAYSQRRARDWQFFAPGREVALQLAGIEVPFGRDPAGGMMSDHIGYVARFRLNPARTHGNYALSAVTRSDRSKG